MLYMKTLSKIQINPIHRDLLIALITGFTMAVVLVSTVVIAIGWQLKRPLDWFIGGPFLLVAKFVLCFHCHLGPSGYPLLAIFKNFFLPNRHLLLNRINNKLACFEGIFTMRSRHCNSDRYFTRPQSSDPVAYCPT